MMATSVREEAGGKGWSHRYDRNRKSRMLQSEFRWCE